MVGSAVDFTKLRLGDFLEEVSARTPAPGGGSVAAIAGAMAAGLTSMAARFSEEYWPDARGAVAQAETLRSRLAFLAQVDADAYEEALATFRLPKDVAPAERDAAIGLALSHAADVPLQVAEVATDVAELAALVAEHGNPNLRGDAAAAALLAEAVARAAANLVAINLGVTAEDERIARSHRIVEAAAAAAKRALAAEA